jgi:hypothetical protein
MIKEQSLMQGCICRIYQGYAINRKCPAISIAQRLVCLRNGGISGGVLGFISTDDLPANLWCGTYIDIRGSKFSDRFSSAR